MNFDVLADYCHDECLFTLSSERNVVWLGIIGILHSFC